MSFVKCCVRIFGFTFSQCKHFFWRLTFRERLFCLFWDLCEFFFLRKRLKILSQKVGSALAREPYVRIFDLTSSHCQRRSQHSILFIWKLEISFQATVPASTRND